MGDASSDVVSSGKPGTVLSNNFRGAITSFRPRVTLPSKTRILSELKKLGVGRYGLLRLSSRYLPKVIHPFEHIQAVVYGRNREGSVMLVATDSRIIYLDKKPMFINYDEVTYDVVAGVTYGHVGLSSTVNLHTRMGDYKMKTINTRCADRFVNYIEWRCLGQIRLSNPMPDKLVM